MKVNASKCAITGMLYRHASTRTEPLLSKKNIELLKALTKEVKIQGAEIPFYHPDKEPYRYLGVLITPTLNWSYNLKTIREEMRFRAEKTVNCLLACHQKVQVQETNIKPYISYSFPLGTLTEADLGQLDAMYARICKTIYRLPMSTPTAMVLEDKNKAGMGLTSLSVTYASDITQNMLAALNDEGALGFITRALLQLQNNIIGSAVEGKQGKIVARHTTHYHLARQMAVIKEAGLYIQTPEDHADLNENALVSVINCIKYNTADLGITCKIPLQVYQPLLELGLQDLRDLLTRNRKATIMSSDELTNKYGKRAKPRHQIALNRLTLILNSTHLNLDPSKWRTWNTRAALDIKHRIVHNSELFSDLAGADTRSLDTPDLTEHVQKALDELQNWRQARENRNRRTRRKPSRTQAQHTEVLVCNTTHRGTEDSKDMGASHPSSSCTDTDDIEQARHTSKPDSTINWRRACMKRNLQPSKRQHTYASLTSIDKLAETLARKQTTDIPKQECRKKIYNPK